MWKENKEIIYRRIKGGRIKIDYRSLTSFSMFIQNDSKKNEAGGVLLGRMIINTKDVVIDTVSSPQKTDKRKRNYFKRNNGHQGIIDSEWKKSQGTCNYLGEWHTHPEEIPVPSLIDLKSWKKQLKNAKYEGEALFFIIVGIKEIVVYEGESSTLKISQLSKY